MKEGKTIRKHKWKRMRFLGMKETGLATYSCSICKNYCQFGVRREKAYCNGIEQRFEG